MVPRVDAVGWVVVVLSAVGLGAEAVVEAMTALELMGQGVVAVTDREGPVEAMEASAVGLEASAETERE